MTLDEQIELLESNAEFERKGGDLQGCLNFRQLANWLKDYKKLLEQEPCDDCISREETLKALMDEWTDFDSELMDYLIEKVRKLPSVTPQPKMGQWIDIMVGDMPAQACDQCNTFYPLAYTGGGHKYCPNCGAKMQEWVNDENS